MVNATTTPQTGAQPMASDIADDCTWRKARKSYRCASRDRFKAPDCVRIIRPGTRYVEYADGPMYQSGTRYCEPCARYEQGELGGHVPA